MPTRITCMMIRTSPWWMTSQPAFGPFAFVKPITLFWLTEGSKLWDWLLVDGSLGVGSLYITYKSNSLRPYTPKRVTVPFGSTIHIHIDLLITGQCEYGTLPPNIYWTLLSRYNPNESVFYIRCWHIILIHILNGLAGLRLLPHIANLTPPMINPE